MGLKKIRGTSRDDTLNGSARAEELRGEGGNDTINGGDGNDQLRGGKGDDALNGDAGNDRLKGDGGHDLLTGGTGADRFVFDLQGGADAVTDFGNGADKLDFTNFGLSGTASLAFAEQVGANVLFDDLATGASVLLLGVQLSSLDASDFVVGGL